MESGSVGVSCEATMVQRRLGQLAESSPGDLGQSKLRPTSKAELPALEAGRVGSSRRESPGWIHVLT
jgi:hypothetical protein